MRQLLKAAHTGGTEADGRQETHNTGAARTMVIQTQRVRFREPSGLMMAEN